MTKRRPTHQEATALVRAIRATPNITGYTTAEWTGAGPVFVAEDGAEVSMAAAAWALEQLALGPRQRALVAAAQVLVLITAGGPAPPPAAAAA
ncbi:MAG: hypothetical protein JOZ63_00945, partial [Planctomycetaceae bacterium]|nr:hypothetical protein [Planctomycetaceae bacterium]